MVRDRFRANLLFAEAVAYDRRLAGYAPIQSCQQRRRAVSEECWSAGRMPVERLMRWREGSRPLQPKNDTAHDVSDLTR